MITRVNIAIDVMGSDKGPEEIIEASSISKTRNPEVKYTYFGNGKLISKNTLKYKNLIDSYQIIHTDEIVLPEDKPSLAIRKRKNSSMGKALTLLKEKKVEALVSAGNTGALMAMSKLELRMLDGILRPAIAATFPIVICSFITSRIFANSVFDKQLIARGIAITKGREQIRLNEALIKNYVEKNYTKLKQTTSKANILKVSGVFKTLAALPIIQSEPCAIFSLV